MQRLTKDIVRIGAGVVFLLLGLAGLVLPVLQGVLFLMLAAILLAPYSRHVRSWLAWAERRYPRLAARLRRVHLWPRHGEGS